MAQGVHGSSHQCLNKLQLFPHKCQAGNTSKGGRGMTGYLEDPDFRATCMAITSGIPRSWAPVTDVGSEMIL